MKSVPLNYNLPWFLCSKFISLSSLLYSVEVQKETKLSAPYQKENTKTNKQKPHQRYVFKTHRSYLKLFSNSLKVLK